MKGLLRTLAVPAWLAVLGLSCATPTDEDPVRRLARADCREARKCDCPNYSDACQETLEAKWGEILTESRLQGGTFDPDCVERYVDVVERFGCDGPASFTPAFMYTCDEYCRFYVGEVGEGGTCERANDCAQGLFCDQGTCRSPCDSTAKAREGEECFTLPCDFGLYCQVDYEAMPLTSECRELRAGGDPCSLGESCDSGTCMDGYCTMAEPVACVIC